MTTSTSERAALGPIVVGKWNGRRYRVVRKLGEGANGAVYLVMREGRPFALKVGFDTIDLQSEINAIEALRSKRSLLIDADDCEANGRTVAFYVTPYAEGSTLGVFMRRHGEEWLSVIVGRLLRLIGDVHRAGFAFGDLKPENVMVSEYGQVALVDYGGMTPMGKSVRQFTELYDRGYWQAGSRTADERYDLFSLAAMLILLFAGSAAQPQGEPADKRGVHRLLQMAQGTAWGRQAMPFLRKALGGSYAQADAALADWRRLMMKLPGSAAPRRSGIDWLRTAFVGSVLLFACALYLFIR